MSKACRVLNIFRQDTLSAALSLCYDFTSNQAVSASSALRAFSGPDVDHCSLLETTEALLKDTIDGSGFGVKHYYFVTACLGLVRKSANKGQTAFTTSLRAANSYCRGKEGVSKAGKAH